MSDRREFLGAIAALSAGAALRIDDSPAPPAPASDAWLDQLKGKHRQLFDAPDPDGGTVLRHVRNYLDAWREAYGVGERDVLGVSVDQLELDSELALEAAGGFELSGRVVNADRAGAPATAIGSASTARPKCRTRRRASSPTTSTARAR